MTARESYSSLSLHRRCPQAWHYQTVRQLVRDDPTDVKAELEFGNWWHALRAGDSIDRGRRIGSLQWTPRLLSTVDDWPKVPTEESEVALRVLDSALEWWEQLPAEYQQTWVDRMGEPVVPRLQHVDARWRARWKHDLLNEEPLAVEFFWKRVLPPDPDGDDPDTLLVGFVDEIYFDQRRNMIVMRDHKSHRQLAQQTTADDLMDSQLQVYAWGAYEDVVSWGRGSPRAVAYDRVRMVAPKSPEVTLSGTLSKSVTDYDLATYLEWAKGPDGQGVPYPGRKKDGSGAGVYTAEQNVIDRLSQPAASSAWFQRTLTPLNTNIVRSHLLAAVDTSLDMISTRRRIEATGEAGRNLHKTCKWCDYVKICRAELVGGMDGEYVLSDYGLKPKPKKNRGEG